MPQALKSSRCILFVLVAAAGLSLSSAPADSIALADGRRFLDEGRYDFARELLMESALSEDDAIRTESFLYLNVLEMELENYDAALVWLEKYHAEAMKIFRQALDAEKRISAHEEKTVRSIVGLRWLVVGGICAMALVAITLALSMRRRTGRSSRKIRLWSPALKWEQYLASAEIFTRTPIYAEIAELERQPADRRARVLNHSRQEALDAELAKTFSEFIAALQAEYQSLTAGDLKLCCLSLVPLSSFGRALCFGSTETNIIKQRKHKIKRKLTTDDAGRQLFEFVFAPRRSKIS